MNVPICDICGHVVHGKRWMSVVVPMNVEDSMERMIKDPQEYFQYRANQRKEIERASGEMCESCKKLHERLLTLKKEEANKLKEASDKILKEFLKEV